MVCAVIAGFGLVSALSLLMLWVWMFVVCGYGLRLFDLLFCGAVYVTWWWLFVWYAASWLCMNVVPLRLLRCVAGCS